MKLKIDFEVPKLKPQINLQDSIMLVGSCFTENMGEKLRHRKFNTYQNPHGIIFNPVSVWSSFRDVIRKQEYTVDHIFNLNDAWHSWSHHSRFSANTPEAALGKMNQSIEESHVFLKKCEWVIITLGSAFAYRNEKLDMHVSNNHKAPTQWFAKELLTTEFMQTNLQKMMVELKDFNPNCKIIYTISPVRHLRDGLVDNNRSKARLIEVVHQLVADNDNAYYFPSYEIVIDELRDYRFYDIDFAHPNYLATQYVWEHFQAAAINTGQYELIDKLYKINLAVKHRSSNLEGVQHQQFIASHIALCKELQTEYDFLNFDKELALFNANLK